MDRYQLSDSRGVFDWECDLLVYQIIFQDFDKNIQNRSEGVCLAQKQGQIYTQQGQLPVSVSVYFENFNFKGYHHQNSVTCGWLNTPLTYS